MHVVQVIQMTESLRRFSFLRPAMLMAVVTLLLAATWGDTAEAQQNYETRSGDILGIEVLEDPSLNREVLILPDGRFNFPFVGSVQAGGRTTDQIAAALREGIADNFAAPPNVFVSVRTLRPVVRGPSTPAVAPVMNIYFLGEVNAPGPKEVRPGSTLIQALSFSGGFTNFAALKRIQLRRTDQISGRQSVVTIDYNALSRGAALSQDIVLGEGDVILVPQRRLFE